MKCCYNFDEARLARWAKAVKARYGYKCYRCFSKKNIEAHHIYPKSKYPKKAYMLKNGVALCRNCHRVAKDSYHSMYGVKGNPKLFNEWIRKTAKKRKIYKMSNFFIAISLLAYAIYFVINHN